jgi:hypothetical protein
MMPASGWAGCRWSSSGQSGQVEYRHSLLSGPPGSQGFGGLERVNARWRGFVVLDLCRALQVGPVAFGACAGTYTVGEVYGAHALEYSEWPIKSGSTGNLIRS